VDLTRHGIRSVVGFVAMSDIRNLFAKSHIRKRQRLDPESAETETNDAEPSTSASESVPSAALHDERIERPVCDNDVPAEALALDFEEVFGCCVLRQIHIKNDTIIQLVDLV